MEYVVKKRHTISADDGWHNSLEIIEMLPGDMFDDGLVEPDVVAGLCSRGIIQPVKTRVKMSHKNRKEK
jgi:hypothetical protein